VQIAFVAFAVNVVASIALGAIASALAPKPKTPNLAGGFSAKAKSGYLPFQRSKYYSMG